MAEPPSEEVMREARAIVQRGGGIFLAIVDAIIAAEARGRQKQREEDAELADVVADAMDVAALNAKDEQGIVIYREKETTAIRIAAAIRNQGQT